MNRPPGEATQQAAWHAGRIVEDVQRALAGRAEARRLWLEAEIDPRLGTLNVYGDEPRVRQVLTNFVCNALEFTHEGGVCARAAVVSLEPHAVRIRYEVIDTGVGLSSALLQQVCILFDADESAPLEPLGFSGRGLSVNRELVGLLGGRIGVTSVPGMGCTFWFEVLLQRCFDELPVAVDGDAAGVTHDSAAAKAGADRTVRHVDRAAGLKYALGRADLYERVLGRFADQHGDDHAVLVRALAAGNRESARRLLHTLKSVAALIGARGLRAEATRLEQRCNAGASSADLSGELGTIERELRLVAADIDWLRAELREDTAPPRAH